MKQQASKTRIITTLFKYSQIQRCNPTLNIGCHLDVYVLDNAIQSGICIHNKWEYRSKLGLYLGRSPNHRHNVALVLDRTTRLVSPQFHVTFDPRFYTTKQDEFDTHRQTKSGLLVDEKIKKIKKHSIYEYKREMPEKEGVNPRKKTILMTQDSNNPEEQPNVGKYTLEDTDNLKVTPNDSNLVNTRGYSPENPEATRQYSVKKL